MRIIAFLVGLAIFLLVVGIAITNQQEVTVTYYFSRSWTGKLWMAIMASFGAGVMMAIAFSSLLIVREKFRVGMLNRKTGRLEEEVKSLRQRPMPDEHPVFPSVAAISPPSQGNTRS
ncbi:MAG: LapA family protein [Nitrospinota bacterium]|nr:LapA family protein [Nitrospinota bacterium]